MLFQFSSGCFGVGEAIYTIHMLLFSGDHMSDVIVIIDVIVINCLFC